MTMSKYISLILLSLMLLLNGCGRKVPDIPDPKAEIIDLNITKTEMSDAKKIFLPEFYNYLISPVWKDVIWSRDHQNFYTNVMQDYKFVGAKELKGKSVESTLFLYEWPILTGRKAVTIFTFSDTSYAKAVYIQKINCYGLIISNAQLQLANGAISDIKTSSNATWSFAMPYNHSWSSTLWYDRVRDYMIWQSGEMDKNDKTTLFFTFMTKDELNHFASLLLSTFPIIKQGTLK